MRVHRCANTHVYKCGMVKTHTPPADFLVRTLISVVVTSEGCYRTARHLDTHGILHYCVSKSTCVSVCVCSRVCVHTRCPLDVGGRCHQLFLDGPQVQMFVAMLDVRYWPTWYRIHKYMDAQHTCMQTCVWLLQDSCIHLGEWSHMWSCKSFVNVYEDQTFYSVQFQIKRYLKSQGIRVLKENKSCKRQYVM